MTSQSPGSHPQSCVSWSCSRLALQNAAMVVRPGRMQGLFIFRSPVLMSFLSLWSRAMCITSSLRLRSWLACRLISCVIRTPRVPGERSRRVLPDGYIYGKKRARVCGFLHESRQATFEQAAHGLSSSVTKLDKQKTAGLATAALWYRDARAERPLAICRNPEARRGAIVRVVFSRLPSFTHELNSCEERLESNTCLRGIL